MIQTVTDAEYMGEYTLMCAFSDGVIKIVDITPLLKYPAFQELEDAVRIDNLTGLSGRFDRSLLDGGKFHSPIAHFHRDELAM